MTASARRADRFGTAGGPTAGGYLHELGVYASDEEFGALIHPFALEGLEAGEPVVFAYDPHKTELLRRWLPASPDITYVTDTGPYATPAKALVGWRKVIEERLGAGAPRVRIAGDVPHPGYGRPYAGWDRYEAAIDRALGDLPVWAPCLYDARIAPSEVLETAARRHRRVVACDGTRGPNASFEPVEGLADFLTPDVDPLERTAPLLELLDASPPDVRAAIRQVTTGLLSPDQTDDLVLAVCEAVTNAHVHGSPPVSAKVWRGDDRVVVSIHDHGCGPLDPLVGLLPRDDDAEFGRGLWLAHHLDLDVALIPSPDGFSVRLRAGALGA